MAPGNEALLRDLRALREENARLKAVERELALAIESLKESEERLRLAVEAAHIGVWQWDIPSDRVSWDAKKHDVFGLAQGSFAGTKDAFFELVYPDDRAALQAALTAALDHGVPYQNEFRIIGASGDIRWISNLAQISRDDDGRPIRMIGVVHDVTERHTIEKTLRDSEQKFRSFVETTSEWIWEVDIEGFLTYSNPVVETILGYRPEELLGKSLAAFVHDADQDLVQRVLKDAVAHKRGWTGMSVRCRHRDQSYRHLECHGLPVLDDRGNVVGFRGSDRDVTDRLDADQARRDASRLEAIGRLAGGFAHHFNNLLTVIVGHGDLALDGAQDTDLQRDLDAVRQAAQRGTLLTRQLLAFAGKQLMRPRAVDLNAELHQMHRTLQRLVGGDIELRMRLDPALWTVCVDPAQLEIALVNLTANAEEAMPNGGVLTITTANVASTDAQALHEPEVMPGDYVVISVTDTGKGMTTDVAEKAFEPFFTTKEIGAEIVGLGLPTCYGIVAQQGGHIRMHTEPNVGSTFRLFLRRASSEAVATKATTLFSSPDSTIVLIVDDDETVSKVAARILRARGYTVLEAHNGADALAVVRSWQGPIHVLLTSVTMVGMNGPDLAAQLTRERPGVQTVFMSGPGHEAIVQCLQTAGSVVVRKPFTPGDLATSVRRVLRDPPNESD